ncbi:circadian clock protein KaiB [bacterium]|nr:circadian clock protein KaiB [bacterium]
MAKKKEGRKIVLRLYVTGQTPNSVRAMENLKKVLKKDLKEIYELQVIDVLKNPQLAEDEKILATPMLSRVLPLPVRRIIGDLSDKEKVLLGLDLV